MTNEELNRYIHEKVLGKCVWDNRDCRKLGANAVRVIFECNKCGLTQDEHKIPDFCTDLNAMAEAEAATIKAKGEKAFLLKLCKFVLGFEFDRLGIAEIVKVATAPPTPRARAVVAAWEEE
jgi:hypothetical protein